MSDDFERDARGLCPLRLDPEGASADLCGRLLRQVESALHNGLGALQRKERPLHSADRFAGLLLGYENLARHLPLTAQHKACLAEAARAARQRLETALGIKAG